MAGLLLGFGGVGGGAVAHEAGFERASLGALGGARGGGGSGGARGEHWPLVPAAAHRVVCLPVLVLAERAAVARSVASAACLVSLAPAVPAAL